MTSWIYGLAGVPLAAACAGVALHRLASGLESRRFPPPGEIVGNGSPGLHIHREGEGSPAVVFDAALAGTSLSWFAVRPAVAALTTAVSYDRAGFGWSRPVRDPRRVDRLVDELRRGLAAAAIPPPYVLVGHSYGGWIARLFASRHLDEVAGLVLLDVPHPREWMAPSEERRKRIARGARLARRASALAHFGATRLAFRLARPGRLPRGAAPEEENRILSLLEKLPESMRGQVRSFWVRPWTLAALASLIENAPASAALVAGESRELGDRPLVVLSASRPTPERIREQEEVAALSRRGRHAVAEKSGHFIPLDEPALVVEVVREVVLLAREAQSGRRAGGEPDLRMPKSGRSARTTNHCE